MATTLHVSRVPHEVKEKLDRLAEREHLSLHAYVLRQLQVASLAADNAMLLDSLASFDISTGDILDARCQARRRRDS